MLPLAVSAPRPPARGVHAPLGNKVASGISGGGGAAAATAVLPLASKRTSEPASKQTDKQASKQAS